MDLTRIPWEPFWNSTNESIPPFAIVTIDGRKKLPSGELVSTVAKPDQDGATFLTRVCWQQSTEPDAIGYFSLPYVTPMLAAYDGETPGAQQLWGPQADSFLLKKNHAGFRSVGTVGVTADHAALFLFDLELTPSLLLVRSEQSYDKGFTGTFTVYEGFSEPTDRTEEIYVRIGNYAADKWGYAGYVNGRLELINAECEDDE